MQTTTHSDDLTDLGIPSDAITLEALAKRLNLHKSTIFRWCQIGVKRGRRVYRLPTVKVGRRRLISKKVFRDWLASYGPDASGDGKKLPPDEVRSDAMEREAAAKLRPRKAK